MSLDNQKKEVKRCLTYVPSDEEYREANGLVGFWATIIAGMGLTYGLAFSLNVPEFAILSAEIGAVLTVIAAFSIQTCVKEWGKDHDFLQSR